MASSIRTRGEAGNGGSLARLKKVEAQKRKNIRLTKDIQVEKKELLDLDREQSGLDEEMENEYRALSVKIRHKRYEIFKMEERLSELQSPNPPTRERELPIPPRSPPIPKGLKGPGTRSKV